ncbi:MAG: DUF1559 domain-containing protein [Pirellulaceae bacterium]
MEDAESTRPEDVPEEERALLRHPVWGRVAFYAASAVVIGVLVLLLIPSQGARKAARRAHIQYQLKQIGIALLNYEADYGQFPPATIADEEGRPMHSWRVLILPYLEHTDLHAEYDFDQPWDHPLNLPLLEKTPGVYESPWTSKDDPPGLTPCVAFSAVGTVLGTTEGAKRADISQDLSEIPVVVGNFQQPIPWTQPTDISPRQWVALHGWMVDNEKYPSVTIQADGSVRAVDLREPPEDLAGRSVIKRRSSGVP